MDTRGDNRPAGRSLNSEINITPLVDVMLVVLIIFIVVTPLLQEGVAVDLPAARNVVDAGAGRNQTLTVVLQDDGQILLGTDPVEAVDLTGALQAAHWTHPERPLCIKADRNLPYGEIKRILIASRAAGFRDVSLIAREATPSGSKSHSGTNLAERGD
jgi:biopolymer transport protein ExbD